MKELKNGKAAVVILIVFQFVFLFSSCVSKESIDFRDGKVGKSAVEGTVEGFFSELSTENYKGLKNTVLICCKG